MNSANRSGALRRASLRDNADRGWNERAGRLFGEFERPARTMVRRAFRGAFADDQFDDIYAGAWVGTLRALAARHEELSDEEIRSYLLTAVANQAGKELRRRRRKPTASLEQVGGVAVDQDSPEDLVASAEQSRVTRDLLGSLPPRRRAVILLRYGWGLEPSQVCGLIAGLSPRAYRKEITRGVEELTEKMRALERGDWCADREPVLRALVAGLADPDQERQARAHLSHCRSCSEFVARLSDHLHELGGSIGLSGAFDGIDGQLSFADRLGELGDRIRELAGTAFSRAPEAADEAAARLATAGGARGAGAAGTGVLAKLTGLGGAGKLAVACLGGGVAATACVVAGVAPLGLGPDNDRPVHERHPPQARDEVRATVGPAPDTLPPRAGDARVGSVEPAPNPAQSAGNPPPAGEGDEPPSSEPPVAPSTPAVEREFGVAAAAAPATPVAPAPTSASSSSSTGSGGGGSAVEQEFGP